MPPDRRDGVCKLVRTGTDVVRALAGATLPGMSVPGGWELVIGLPLLLALLVCFAWRLRSRSSRTTDTSAVMVRSRVPLTLAVLGLVMALWPVRADSTRYELESGLQPAAQLEARLADPAQRPWLTARPLCGLPVLAPVLYMQHTSLRRGCAGPNARSMSIAVAVLLLAAAGAVREGRRQADPQPLRPA
jgi:hypothetical protein